MDVKVPKVVVIGGAYVDMAVKCDQIPYAGQNVTGSSLSYTLTGPGPNEAATASICGCRVHLISKIGGDAFGQMAKANLAEYQINTDFVYSAEAMNTGMFVTLVNAGGENATVTYSGANSALVTKDLETAEQIITEADVCLIHGRLPQEAITSALRLAKVGQTKVILNPASPIEKANDQDSPLPSEYFTADILIPNLYEAVNITQTMPAIIRREAAKLIATDLIARGAGAAVITMGKRGCLVVDREGSDYTPAFEIELVDKTCTGDAFAGALAASCAAGDDLRKAVKFASAAGALACTKFGAIESLPTKAEIIELLQKEDIEQ